MTAQSTVSDARKRSALSTFSLAAIGIACAVAGEAALGWLRKRRGKPEKKEIQTWEGEGGNLSPREPASTQQPN
jgi:hypothetical protein